MSASDFIVAVPVLDEELGVDKSARYTRAQALALSWRHTHRDFKSSAGYRALLVNRNGTTAVPLDALTDAEISDRIVFAHKQERKRLAAKAVRP